jgi:hypothetical protein
LIRLEPDENCVKKIDLIDPTLPWGYKFTYNYKCLDKLFSDKNTDPQIIIDLVKEHGQLK